MTNAEKKKARKMLEDAVWNRTHRDFKGGRGSSRSILVLAPNGATTIAYLSSMSDAKLRALLGVGGFEERWHERTRKTRRMAKVVR